MSSLALYRGLHLHRTPLPISVKAPARTNKGFFRHISAAIERWQQRHTEREAARFIAEHGGRLTDDIERQLTERFNGRGFPPDAPRSFRPFAGL
jgi:hypothetical protein